MDSLQNSTQYPLRIVLECSLSNNYGAIGKVNLKPNGDLVQLYANHQAAFNEALIESLTLIKEIRDTTKELYLGVIGDKLTIEIKN